MGDTDAMAGGASVVVVGGGVMGCSVAFHLAERGVDTLVLERARSARACRPGQPGGRLACWSACTTVTGHREHL
jgi:glycine/D-amino acid oxidase-like deaminating enzyme